MTKPMEPRSPRTATVCVHGGEKPDPVTGASSPNLVMSSSYAVREQVSFSACDIDDDTPFVYSRWGNPTVAQLETKLRLLERAEDCVCLASGMAATGAVFLSLLSSGDHAVVSEINYPGSAELFRDTLPRFGIEVSPVDTSDPDAVETAMRPNTRLLWCETPANPIMRLSDISALAALARERGCLLGVDSTFATPIATRPLDLGADLVVHSLTKYIGGHGDAIGGAVLGSHQLISRIRGESAVHQGAVLSPFNAWMILRGAATLPLRMRAHQENAAVVARHLEGHPAVERVLWPGLASFPQHDLARRQMDNFSGMMAFAAKAGRSLVEPMIEHFETIHYAVSLGHHRTLIYWMDTGELLESSYRLQGGPRARYRETAGAGLFRLSVGIEDPRDIIDDLERVIGG